MQNAEEKSDGGYGVHFHIYAFLKESANVCSQITHLLPGPLSPLKSEGKAPKTTQLLFGLSFERRVYNLARAAPKSTTVPLPRPPQCWGYS